MSQVPQCNACSIKYDEIRHNPLKLPCGHNICQQCAEGQYENSEEIKCQQCGNLTDQRPKRLPEDQEILDIITRKKKQIKTLKESNNNLQTQFNNHNEILMKISENQSAIIQKSFNSLQKTIFKSCNSFVDSFQGSIVYIQDRIQLHETQIENLEKNEQQALEKEDFQRIIQGNTFQEEQQIGNKQINKLEKLITSFIPNLDKFLEDFNTKLEKQLELCQRLSQKMSFQSQSELKRIITVNKDTQIQKGYQLNEKQFKEAEINIAKTEFSCTQIEQIGELKMIISGGRKQETNQKFTMVDNQNVQNYTMLQGRNYHRTVFDQFSNVYILSGQRDYQEHLKECEVFSLENNQFQQIKDIEFPVECFGAFIDKTENIYVSGGYVKILKLTNKIQIYDCEKNE